jgi:uncharacterized BrkB/YihY/UPF0761 family membrane protein
MPTSVRVAVIVLSILAGLLLLVAAVNLYALQEFSERIAAEQGISESDAQSSILLLLAPYVVLGLVFALAAWFVPRRHAWARWLGLAAAAMLAVLHVLSAAMGGGITVLTLLLFVLCLATITSLVARTTSAWIPRLRARR